MSLRAYDVFSFGAEVALLFRVSPWIQFFFAPLGSYSLPTQMLSQVIRAMECLFAPFVRAKVLLFRLVAELMSSAVFGSGKNLYGGDKRGDSSATY